MVGGGGVGIGCKGCGRGVWSKKYKMYAGVEYENQNSSESVLHSFGVE